MSSGSFDTKERVKQAIDIVDLVGNYIPLRRQGRNYVGLCPWHDDSRPSLQVNPERQSFKCWVCDLGGDAQVGRGTTLDVAIGGLRLTGLRAAILGLGLNEGAYLSEIVRSGLNSVDKGQWEASTALGMKRGTTLRRIVIPQAMRVIVPPTGNETISMLKTTSLVMAVPFMMELQFVSGAIGNKLFLPVPLLLVAAIWYLVITSILMVGQARLEAFYGKGFDDERPLVRAKGMSRRQQAILTAHTVRDTPNLDVTP